MTGKSASGPHRDAPRPSETEQVERLGLWLHTHYPGWIHEKLEIGLLTNRWRAYAKTLYDLGVRIPGLGGSDAGVAARIEALSEAAAKVLEGFDRGIFTRATEDDGSPGWTLKLLPYIAALSQLAKLSESARLLREEPRG